MFTKKNKIVIYTAIFGGKDKLMNPLFKIKNADLVCFTDDPNNKSPFWKTIVHKPTQQDSNRSAKKYKVLGDDYLNKYEYSIWLDANQIIKIEDASLLIEENLITTGADIAFMKHPDGRDCIYDEYDFIMQFNHIVHFDDPEIMRKQMDYYHSIDFPRHFGLVAGGFIIRKIHSQNVKKLTNEWWSQISNFSRRDQLSFNFAVWKTGVKYYEIDKNYWDNIYMKVEQHNAR